MSKRDAERQELIEKLKQMARASRNSIQKGQPEEDRGRRIFHENAETGTWAYLSERGRMPMKLAEALQERADVQKRIAQIKRRLRSNARV